MFGAIYPARTIMQKTHSKCAHTPISVQAPGRSPRYVASGARNALAACRALAGPGIESPSVATFHWPRPSKTIQDYLIPNFLKRFKFLPLLEKRFALHQNCFKFHRTFWYYIFCSILFNQWIQCNPFFCRPYLRSAISKWRFESGMVCADAKRPKRPLITVAPSRAHCINFLYCI